MFKHVQTCSNMFKTLRKQTALESEKAKQLLVVGAQVRLPVPGVQTCPRLRMVQGPNGLGKRWPFGPFLHSGPQRYRSPASAGLGQRGRSQSPEKGGARCLEKARA